MIAAVLAVAIVVCLYAGTMLVTRIQLRPTQVPLAVTNIPGTGLISANDIKVVTIPGMAVPPDTILNPKEIIGKYVLPGQMVHKYGFFYKDQLSDTNTMPGGDLYKLPPGEHLFPIASNMMTSLAGQIVPGSKIDIWFTSKPDSKTQQIVTGLLFHDVYVVDVRNNDNQVTIPDTVQPSQNNNNNGGNQNQQNQQQPTGQKTIPTVMLVLLSDEQIQYMIAAESIGMVIPVGNHMEPANQDSGAIGVTHVPSALDWLQDHVVTLPKTTVDFTEAPRPTEQMVEHAGHVNSADITNPQNQQ